MAERRRDAEREEQKVQIPLLNIPLTALSIDDLIGCLVRWLDEATPGQGGSASSSPPAPRRIYAVRGATLVAAQRNSRLRQLLQEGDLVLAAGEELRLAARLTQGTSLPVLAPELWIDALLETLARRQAGVFYVGGAAGVAERWATGVSARYPGLKLTVQDGFFEKWGPDNDRVTRAILKAAPQVVLVGLGSPYQEEYVHAHAALFRAPLCISVGPLAETVTGQWPEGPVRVQHSGMARAGSWLGTHAHRTAGQVGAADFLWQVLRQKLGEKR